MTARTQLTRQDLIARWHAAAVRQYGEHGSLPVELSAAVLTAAAAEWAALRRVEAEHGFMQLRGTLQVELER